MNGVSMAIVQKWSPSHPNGRHLVLYTWRRCSKIIAISRPCQELCFMIGSATLRFFISWQMQYDWNGCSYGQLVIGSSVKITGPLMYHVFCRVFGETSNHPSDSAPYSPDLVPCAFWLFPKLKSPLEGKRFQTRDKLQENAAGKLMVIPIKNLAECFEQWKRCCQNCVRSQSAYFEEDWGIIVLCTVFFISCIFFKKCFYFFHSVWLDTFWTDLVCYIYNVNYFY